MTRVSAALVSTVCGLLWAAHGAAADPYRLKADAIAQAESPVGVLVLEADGKARPWLHAEALVWTGTLDSETTGDALVVSIEMRDAKRHRALRLGRFIVSTGSISPIHIDGASGRAQIPWQELQAEVFAGIPVKRNFGASRFDWVTGARVSRRLGSIGSAGIAYMQRRESSQLFDHEVGLDAGLRPTSWLDMGGRAALDLAMVGLAEAHLSVGLRKGAWRVELFEAYRSPSRLLPATSLFSVIGDTSAQRWGAVARWRAAPRLDLSATSAVRFYGDVLGSDASGRATLRLDERGRGALGLELRRTSIPADDDWTGIRATGRVPVGKQMQVSTELELVVPDDAGDRGTVWPWALVAVTYRITDLWSAAVAAEASSSPQYEYRLDALARLTRRFEVGR